VIQTGGGGVKKRKHNVISCEISRQYCDPYVLSLSLKKKEQTYKQANRQVQTYTLLYLPYLWVDVHVLVDHHGLRELIFLS
jgi:hypothetical protein